MRQDALASFLAAGKAHGQALVLPGFDVSEAANGLDAIQRTTAHAPDVVLMDLSASRSSTDGRRRGA